MLIEEEYSIMGTFLAKCNKYSQKGQMTSKSYLITSSLHCGNMKIVLIIFAELCIVFFQICAELWVPNLNQNGTPCPKFGLVDPPRRK